MARWIVKTALILMFATLVFASVAPVAGAQVSGGADGVVLRSPYVGVAVEPGDTTSFDLEVSASPGEEVTFAITDVPSGWTARIRGGGFAVDRVMVDEGLKHNLDLEVEVPQTVPDGSYQITVVATGGASSDSITFDIDVEQAVGGDVTLATEFPALRGPSDVEFTFTLELANDTADEIQFGLQTSGPEGWQIDARPSGQSRASTVTVAAGSTERVTVEVDPPDFTPAGVYQVDVEAAGGGKSASAELAVQITGNFAMGLTTADQRLNVDVEAGKATELPIIVANDGTAPLVDVTLSASVPQGWEMTFVPETIDRIEAGATADVIATVTPADDAITGDYRLTVRSRVAETNDSIEIRATVKTSALWGLVGAGVIVTALGALGLVFRRFGRR
jgi:uncharacterized membrane protein